MVRCKGRCPPDLCGDHSAGHLLGVPVPPLFGQSVCKSGPGVVDIIAAHTSMVVGGMAYRDGHVRARVFELKCNVTVQVYGRFVQLNTAYSRIMYGR